MQSAWVSQTLAQKPTNVMLVTGLPPTIAPAGAHDMSLIASCQDAGIKSLPTISCVPLLLPKTGFGSAGSNKFSHGQVLCPTLKAIQQASCQDLKHHTPLNALLRNVSREPVCCKVGWAGMGLEERELAPLLLKLGHTTYVPSRSDPVHLLVTRSGNGWLALVLGVYLQRLHGGPLAGLLVADGKSEWMHANDVRTLMRQVGFSYRLAAQFDPLPDLALLKHNRGAILPHSLIMPIAGTKATGLLPKGWTGRLAGFTACLRIGKPLRDLEKTRRDIARLVPYCESLAFWSGPPGASEEEPAAHVIRSGSGLVNESGSSDDAAADFLLGTYRYVGQPAPNLTVSRAGNWTVGSSQLETRKYSWGKWGFAYE